MEKCPGVHPKRLEMVTNAARTTVPMTEEHTTAAEEMTTEASHGSTVAEEEPHTTMEAAAEGGA